MEGSCSRRCSHPVASPPTKAPSVPPADDLLRVRGVSPAGRVPLAPGALHRPTRSSPSTSARCSRSRRCPWPRAGSPVSCGGHGTRSRSCAPGSARSGSSPNPSACARVGTIGTSPSSPSPSYPPRIPASRAARSSRGASGFDRSRRFPRAPTDAGCPPASRRADSPAVPQQRAEATNARSGSTSARRSRGRRGRRGPS